jgi:CheY-like chemotaxis protein
VRILVIDDDDDDIQVIDRALMDHGYIPLLARSGEEAVRIAAIQRPDLVLLDIHMPRMNGYEAAATIRAQPGLESVWIVVVSGATDAAERVAEAGFDGYIFKPVDPETLIGQIDGFLLGPAAGRPVGDLPRSS